MRRWLVSLALVSISLVTLDATAQHVDEEEVDLAACMDALEPLVFSEPEPMPESDGAVRRPDSGDEPIRQSPDPGGTPPTPDLEMCLDSLWDLVAECPDPGGHPPGPNLEQCLDSLVVLIEQSPEPGGTPPTPDMEECIDALWDLL